MARILTALALELALGASTLASCAFLIVADEDDEPPEPAWIACAVNSECTLIADGCCSACGEPSLDDVAPVTRRYAEDFRRRLCPQPLACAACPTQNAPSLLAACVRAQCAELDLRTHPASACEHDVDCRPRTAGCCECGGSTAPYDLVAINATKEALYRELTCDPGQACDECLPLYPDGVEAYCAAGGHCALRPATERSAAPYSSPGPPTEGEGTAPARRPTAYHIFLTRQ